MQEQPRGYGPARHSQPTLEPNRQTSFCRAHPLERRTFIAGAAALVTASPLRIAAASTWLPVVIGVSRPFLLTPAARVRAYHLLALRGEPGATGALLQAVDDMRPLPAALQRDGGHSAGRRRGRLPPGEWPSALRHLQNRC
jgi:hypothetical protein